MKISDYIVQFLIEKGITDTFGYPGGSVANLMDSLKKRETQIRAHVMYHEQGAAFAACGYAETKNVPGVVYATGGPGATNLITAIGHAYYDSIPLICITGNVNTYEAKKKKEEGLRQKSFQESDIVSVVKPLTKFCIQINNAKDVKYYIEKAYFEAMDGRRGPVLLDIPMDIFRAEEDINQLHSYKSDSFNKKYDTKERFIKKVKELFECAKSPCLVLGNGIKSIHQNNMAQKVVEKLQIPYVTSMIAFDVIPHNAYYYGFIGAYGKREANFIVSKSDLIICIGSRMDIRQVGVMREKFAPNAQIIRVDIDKNELEYKVHDDELDFYLEITDALKGLYELDINRDFEHWLSVCNQLRETLDEYDDEIQNKFMRRISEIIPENSVITTDVGQNQVWVAQSFKVKTNQNVLFSGGFGAMGHALPAAIGATYGINKVTICICGDGGFQMNIQELQFISSNKLPVKIFLFNNKSLGMIRHFQELYFDKCYFQTTESGGFTTPDFHDIARAYGIRTVVISSPDDIEQYAELIEDKEAVLFEILMDDNTYIKPKLEFGQENQDQWPRLDREMYRKLNELK